MEAIATLHGCVTDLRLLARNYEFGNKTDGLICDRIVGGTRSELVRKMLIKEQDLTLNRCWELIREELSHLELFAEKTVQTANRLLTKPFKTDRDPYLSILEYRNTPIADPKDRSRNYMGRRLPGMLPMTDEHLSPKTVEPSYVRQQYAEKASQLQTFSR